MAIPQQILARVQAARANMGRVLPGGSIPAPRPAPLAGPRRAAAPPAPAVGPLPQEVVDALVRKVEANGIESLTPDEMAALRATAASRETAVAADGIVDDVAGGEVPGDLTDVAPVADDALEQSAVTLESVDAPNITPNRRRVDPLGNLAERVRQATTRSDTESSAGFARLRAEVERLSDADRARLLEHPALAAGIESQAAKTNPEARAAAIANAQARLATLDEMAGVSTTDRAAEQIVGAATAREAVASPRPTPAVRSASADDYQAAKQLLNESIPAGDWNAVLDAYSKLDPERRRAVLAAMPDEAGRYIEQMLDPNADDFSLMPNNVARTLGPTLNPDGSVNTYSELILKLDDAKRRGDTQAYNDILMDIETNPAGAADLAHAKRDFIDRAQARDALRGAIIGTDPMVVEEQARMVNNAILPPPRANITPGARTPEVATRELDPRELPTAADTARAVEAERQLRLEQRAPGGALTEDARKAAFGAEDIRELPLAFRGRDGRSIYFESRPIGSRLTDSNDADAITKGIALEAEVQAALAEMRAANGVSEMAAAQRRYQAANAAIDSAFPPRLVNPSTGEVKPLSKEAIAGGSVPKGWVIERGRKAWSDSHINKPGQAETFDGLLVTIVGGRPKAAPRLDRASPDMTAAERNAMRAEALDTYGETDALDLLPEEVTDEVVELGGTGKKGRLGGAQQQSRVQDALQRLYGTYNPLALTDASGKPLFASAEEAAEDLLRKNTLFKPGTPSYDLARERIAKAVNEAYGPQSSRPATPEITAMEPAVATEPGSTVTPGTSRNPDDIPALDGRRNVAGAPPETDSPGVPQAAAGDPAPNVTQSLDSSGVEIVDTDGTPVGSKPEATVTDTVTGGDVQAEADKVFKETYGRERAAGKSAGQARAAANKARKDHIGKVTGRPISDVSGGTTVEEVTGTGKKGGGRRRGGKKDAPETPEAADATKKDGVDAKPAEGGDVEGTKPKTDGGDGSPPKDGGDGKKPTPATDDKKKPSRLWGAAKLGGLLAAGGVGVGLLARNNAGSASGGPPVDIPLPPGGGGGRGPGGEFAPLPVGSGGDPLDAALAREAAMERALARIRGDRPSDGTRRATQVLQNY